MGTSPCLGASMLVLAALAPPQPRTLQIEVEAPPTLTGVASRVRDEVPDLQSIQTLLGDVALPSRVRIVLAEEQSQAGRSVPTWVSGYALPAIDTIVLFPTRVPSYPDRNLPTLLAHELAHLLVDHGAGGRELPRWFNEGVATVAAREWGLEDSARFAAAVIGPGPGNLREVDEGFVRDAGQVSRSYALSAAVVRHLLRRGGQDAVARLLSRVRRGEPFETAFERTAGLPLAAFETDFFGREVFWRTWVPFLSSSAALWMLITSLALLAIWRRRRLDAAQRALWEAEEDLPPVDPEPSSEPREWIH
ncbi:MAG TPA: hypothetical protein PLS53_16145 [Thermoanaerobaculaceae bacterium]|nr:hypothetical protein [Thermoanaerobaculaceae bacterium]HPS79690.1 hypothetical protein [Thermoanaerobaculaceae bacterium]